MQISMDWLFSYHFGEYFPPLSAQHWADRTDGYGVSRDH
jgi:hypothetical protein